MPSGSNSCERSTVWHVESRSGQQPKPWLVLVPVSREDAKDRAVATSSMRSIHRLLPRHLICVVVVVVVAAAVVVVVVVVVVVAAVVVVVVVVVVVAVVVVVVVVVLLLLVLLLMPKILHDPQHPTYSTSCYPLPRNPLISMLHLHEVMQDLGHSRKPFF